MKKELRQKGFTLIELAIVMVIIGLLIGAVLKGQAMIDDAKNKRLMNDIQGMSAAFYTYYDRYNTLPGDDTAATARWAGVANGDGDGYVGGTATPAPPAGESLEALQALRFAGLISGDPAATTAPGNPYAGIYGFDSNAYGGTTGTKNRLVVTNVPGSVAQIVDTKFDDGLTGTGTVRGSAAYTNGTVTLYYFL
jgi:prepilin-type N-terminal cleavage/methylation domain-containing protein